MKPGESQRKKTHTHTHPYIKRASERQRDRERDKITGSSFVILSLLVSIKLHIFGIVSS